MRNFIFLLAFGLTACGSNLWAQSADLESAPDDREFRSVFNTYVSAGLNLGNTGRYSGANSSRGYMVAYENGGAASNILGLDFISTGGYLGLRTYGYDDNFFGEYNVNSFVAGARLSVLVPQLVESITDRPLGLSFIEPYVTVSAGYEYLAIDYLAYYGALANRFYVGVAAGARVYLLKNFGAYVEVGPNGQGFLQFGAILRLGEL